MTQTYSKKESRALASRQNRSERMKALAARDNTPEKALMRDYVDARFSIGEILLPALVLILATSFLNTIFPRAAVIGTVIMYAYVLAVLADLFFMWRGFKQVLAKRLPGHRHPRPALLRRQPRHPDPPLPHPAAPRQARREVLSGATS